MKTSSDGTINLGDTVTGIHCGVRYTGELWAIDGSGYRHIRFAPGTGPTIFGEYRDIMAVDPDRARDLRLVSRPAVRPEVIAVPDACLGGVRI